MIRTDSTNDEVFGLMSGYVKSISKSPVSCSDTPGFIVNRLLIPYLAQVAHTTSQHSTPPLI